jgi:hypothetical protein
MNSKSDKFKLSPKEYLFLAVCLFIFFVTGLYLQGHGSFPKGNMLIITGIGVVVAIPIVIYMIKNI